VLLIDKIINDLTA